MNEIKFSHVYNKMPEDYEESLLLEIFEKHYDELSEQFIEFDTAITGGGNYPLPHTELIVLLLKTRSGKIWTTIRQHTPQKARYYFSMRGKWFKCVLVG